MDQKLFIHNYTLGAPNAAGRVSQDTSSIMIDSHDGYEWCHLSAAPAATRRYLEKDVELDELVVEAMLARETRPRALVKDDGVLIVLRAANLGKDQDPSDMISIRLWISDDKVISTRFRDIRAVDDIVHLINSNDGPASPGQFLTTITDRLFARMEPFLVDLEECISSAEETLISSGDSEIASDATLARKRTAIFLRHIAPQKMVLETLLNTHVAWMTTDDREHLVESLDRVTRYVEELQELRARSQILNDELSSAHGRRLNDITYVFSVAATIFLPLSFLTGLMGINIGGMPGVQSDQAFWAFSGLCVALVVLQVLVLRKLEWF